MQSEQLLGSLLEEHQRVLKREIKELKDILMSIPKWISLSDVALEIGISRQALYAKLHNGNFEPDVDFKYKGNRIYVARSAVSRLKRLRK